MQCVGSPCQHTIAANGMCVSADDHETRFRKDCAKGAVITVSREVYRGIKLATCWPETAACRNPIHPGGSTDLSIFFRLITAIPSGKVIASGRLNNTWGAMKCRTWADDDDAADADCANNGLRPRVEAEMAPLIDDALARCRRTLLSQVPELQQLNQLVTDTTDRVLTDKELLAEWVAELRQHYALPFSLDMTRRDSILSFGSAVAIDAVMKSRSEQLRTAIAAFTNHLNGTRFGASNAPRKQHSKNVLQQPARKRGRRCG